MAEFVNLDAAWLAELAEDEYIAANPATSARLRLIAQRLESMDEKLRNLQSTKTYADGVRDERMRMLSRSNLPIQSIELTPELVAAIKRTPVHKVTKPKPKPPAPRGLSPEAAARLANISINIGALRRKE